MSGLNIPRLLVLVITFLTVSQLPRVNSQAPPLELELQEKQAYLEALNDYPNLIEEELKDAQDALHELWTVYLPELWRNNSITPKCKKSVEDLIPALNDHLPYKFPVSPKILLLLDAAGKQGAGLLSGNLALSGAYDECFSYNYTGYCLAYQVNLTFSIPKFPLSWKVGLCVPKYCTNTDLAVLLNSTKIFVVSEYAIKCEDEKIPRYEFGAIFMLVVTMIFTTMVLVGTTVDLLLQYIPFFLRGNYDSQSVAVNGLSGDSDPGASEKMPLLIESTIIKKPKGVRPWDFITAFSLFKTVPTLLATKQAPNVITSLNGLRVISMFWVILGHSYLWGVLTGSVDNPVVMLSILKRFSFQAVENGFFSVDSFFFLSGVLVAYLTLREMKKKNGRFPFLHFYIHRYLRLTPTYAFVLFFSWALFNHMAYAPDISLGFGIVGNCAKYWWTNLLYINNFYPWKETEECFAWGWYLANDMQFYIISPFILIPLYYIFPLALIIVAVLLLCSFIVTATLVVVYDFQPNLFASLAYNYTQTSSVQYTDAVYSKPWSRIQPYLVGLVLGYILYKGVRLPFGRKKNVFAYLLIWVVAGIILIPDVYGLYSTWHGHVPGTFENAVYLSFCRFLWGVGLALIVFACHNGYGWFINSFLSMKMWTPLARMTFNAYLVHPVVLSVVYGQFQKSFHYTDITVAFFLIGFVIISYGVAGVVCLLVEFPLGTIEMLVFKVVGMKGRETQRQVEVVLKSKDED